MNINYESIILILLDTEEFVSIDKIKTGLKGLWDTTENRNISFITDMCKKMEKNGLLEKNENNDFRKTPIKINVQTSTLKKRHVHNKNDQGLYCCPYCDYKANKTNTLSMHLRNKHSNECGWETKQHNCDKCEQVFDMKSKLVQHKKRFHNIEKKKCPCCPKTFKLNGVYAHIVNKHVSSDEKQKYPGYSAYKLGRIIYEQSI